MPQQPDPRFIPDVVEDSRFIPDKEEPSNKTDWGLSLKKGFFEGLPELKVLPSWEYPGALRQDWLGSLSRASMYPVEAGVEIYNKLLKPLTSIPNMGLMALGAIAPETIPIAGGVFGAQMATEMPEQAREAYRQAQQTGALSPEAIGKYGELGATGLFAAGAVHGAGKYKASQIGRVAPPVEVITKPGLESFGPVSAGAESPSGRPMLAPEKTLQGTLPFAPPEPARLPQPPSGQQILEFGYGEPQVPIRPPVNPAIAEAISKPSQPTPFMDVAGSKGLEADFSTIEGIQAAFIEGKIDRETALRNMAKVHRKLLNEATKKEPSPVTTVEEGMEINFDPETGEITSEKPYPLTTEPAEGVKKPAGVQEMIELIKTGQAKNVAQAQQATGLSFNGVKPLWYEAKRLIEEESKAVKIPGEESFPPPEIPIGAQKSAGEALLPTPFRTQLKKLYYTDKEINKMTTQEAWDIIKSDKSFSEGDWTERFPAGEPTVPESTLIIPRGEANKTYIAAIREAGYEWQELDEQGNYIFRRAEPSAKEAPGFESKYKGATDEALQGPEFARTKSGGVKIGADVASLGRVLGSSLYSGDISTIATKELLQNSLDAIGSAGANRGPSGKINVRFNRVGRTITVEDNGKGLTRKEVETIFTDLGSSGKRDIESAIGGFGLAKAAPLLGGEHVEVRTVSRNPKTGKITEVAFEGTPDELLQGVDVYERVMPEGTETGTSVSVKVPRAEFYDAERFLKNVVEHSEFEGNIHLYDEYGKKYNQLIKPLTKGKYVTTINTPQADVNLTIPPSARTGDNSRIQLIYRNKGMFQSSEDMWLAHEFKDIPDKVVVDISPNVKEGHVDYPFTANRERLRGEVEEKVKRYIKDNIIEPAKDKYKNELQALYDGMSHIRTKKGVDLYFHDTGGKFTPGELEFMKNSPFIQRIGEEFNSIIRQGLSAVGNQEWINRLERIGIVFDDNLHGIHLPNPTTDMSTILINPFESIRKYRPDEATANIFHTPLHEMAHIEPSATGHGEDFVIRLGDIYAKTGTSRAIYHQQTIRNILTEGSGSYTPEVQRLLSRYNESRGRSTVKDDLLTRTGSKSEIESRGEEGISLGNKPARKGILSELPPGKIIVVKSGQASPINIKRLHNEGFRFIGENEKGDLRFQKSQPSGGSPILEEEVGTTRPTRQAIRAQRIGQLGPIQDAQKSSAVLEAFNLPRGSLASWDISAPFRQGAALIHKKEFWKAIIPMMKSLASEEGFVASQNGIANRPLFKKRIDPITNKVIPSFADDAGLKLTDLTDLSKREEALMSTWAETGGMFTRNKWVAEHGGKQAAYVYSKTYGRGVRASNRAYTGFLNNLRADVFDSLIKDANILGLDTGHNLVNARAIAEFVNTATGRGSLGPLEKAATILNTGLFAPRLIASRIKMLNPATYLFANPVVRKEYLKSFFALATFGNTVLQLAKMAGAEVSNDPNSSDYGKAKIGENVRLDPWAGFQQYIVAVNRLFRPGWGKVPGMEGGSNTGIVPLDLMTGMAGTGGQKVTSSTSGNEYDLWAEKRGPFDPTHLTTGARFLRGKLNPVLGFTMSIADAQREMSGQKMNFGTPNPFENAITQRFIPIFMQDVYQLAQEDPTLLPLAVPAAFGMGVQTYGGIK